jgi:hypothetical protein
MFDVGSAILVPEEDRVQRLTRFEGTEGIISVWYQAMTGDRTEKGPVPLSALRSGVSGPARQGY